MFPQRELQLEIAYRKLERGLRRLCEQRQKDGLQQPKRLEMIRQIREIYLELGRKPRIKRWPL